MSGTLFVILPVYNCEKYISRCIESILSSEYKKIKIICINDGSNDTTPELLEKYNSKIMLINQHNQGPSSARNAALNILPYNDRDFLTFVDGDDYVDPSFFSDAVSLMIKTNADIVCTKLNYHDEICADIEHEITSYDGYTALLELLNDKKINSMVHHKIYKTYLWRDVRFSEDLFFLEDMVALYKIFKKSNSVIYTSKMGYHYNQTNNNSIMRNINSNKYIFSGWRAFLFLLDDALLGFSQNQQDMIKQKMINLFSENFLELFPRVSYFNNNRPEELNRFIILVKSRKYLSSYKPVTFKNMIKKRLFLTSEKLYRFVYRKYIKMFNKKG